MFPRLFLFLLSYVFNNNNKQIREKKNLFYIFNVWDINSFKKRVKLELTGRKYNNNNNNHSSSDKTY
jgi:hypothetical protein